MANIKSRKESECPLWGCGAGWWWVLLAIGFCLNSALIMWDYHSEDMDYFVLPWVEYYSGNGHWSALAQPVGDYNMLYRYILCGVSFLPESFVSYAVKTVSLIFQVLLGVSVGMLVKALSPRKKHCIIASVALVILWPIFVVNTSVWGQCDTLYTTFLILTVYFLLNGARTGRAMICFGVAFSFKLQAILVGPFLLLYFIGRPKEIWKLIVIPSAVYILLLLPAGLIGADWSYMLGIYGDQTRTYWGYYTGLMNLYGLLIRAGISVGATPWPFCLVAGVVLMLITAYWGKRSSGISDAEYNLGLSTLLFTLTIYLLPTMHERYMAPADAMAIALLLADAKRWWLPALMLLLTSVMSYFLFLCDAYLPSHPLLTWNSFVIFSATVIVLWHTMDRMSFFERICGRAKG